MSFMLRLTEGISSICSLEMLVTAPARFTFIELLRPSAVTDYGFERLAVLQESVAREGFAQLQFESGELDALITHEREGHGVGTARTQALQVVAAVLVGHGAVLRTRRGVHGR